MCDTIHKELRLLTRTLSVIILQQNRAMEKDKNN